MPICVGALSGGEGACSRWVAQRRQSLTTLSIRYTEFKGLRLLRSRAGATFLATKACAGERNANGPIRAVFWCVGKEISRSIKHANGAALMKYVIISTGVKVLVMRGFCLTCNDITQFCRLESYFSFLIWFQCKAFIDERFGAFAIKFFHFSNFKAAELVRKLE
ncbi:hypothetical protein PS880_02957 [Pseudomonas fluorescens]|uniref:Uncharacterized protein n=1 Tax=Pseudomonas fluorescens TaxID=294 RepID=A0A5E7KVV5_PSEFL|nr:hypothetical protein PS880_02957 [Pseudomonas fluorescens]